MRKRIWRLYLRLLRWPYLRVRKRLFPWCIRRGCWRRSVVSERMFILGKWRGGRGNVCPVHLWEALMGELGDD